jgi:hypothetical protein
MATNPRMGKVNTKTTKSSKMSFAPKGGKFTPKIARPAKPVPAKAPAEEEKTHVDAEVPTDAVDAGAAAEKPKARSTNRKK